MRVILLSALLLAAVPARADWTKVTENAGAALYVDPASISASGDSWMVSVMESLAEPEPAGTRSRRMTAEVDCNGDRLRTLSGTDYPAPMGQGTSISSWQRESSWLFVGARTGTSIPSQSPYRAVVRFVCSR